MAHCLYCKKKLGWVCDTTYFVDATRPPRICGARRSNYDEGVNLPFSCKSTKFKGEPEDWRCADPDCRAGHAGRRQVVSRKHRYTQPGPNGDGTFCSKTHGWRFGLLAAQAGFRLKAKS
jgi:hypothetical protein